MARLFITPRELNFISDISKEIIKDVIGQKIIYYPISEIKTKTHEVYNEALKKIFDNPIIIDALVNNEFQTNTKIDKFGIDAQFQIEVYIQHRDLVDKGINVNIGDFFSFSDVFYEITERVFMRNIYGMAEHKDGVKLVGIKSRIGLFEAPLIGPTDIKYSDSDAVQDTFYQQRGQKFDKQGNLTGDVRDLVKEKVLDEPLTGQKEVSELGDPQNVGNAFYDDDLITSPVAYTSPTITLSVSEASFENITGETANLREKGNVNSVITGTIIKKYSSAILSSYTVEFQVNGAGGWFAVPGLSNVAITGNPSSLTIPSTVHTPTAYKTANSISYRLRVIDTYQTNTSNIATVEFKNVIFFGPVTSIPTTSTDIRALSGKIFTTGDNPFILSTGIAQRIFTAAMPAPLTIDEVDDLDALNIEITNNYILSSFNVEDAGGTTITYNVYTLNNAIAYSTNHRHQITRV